MSEMFCFQCEQTAAGKACSAKAGVCGKTASVANLQDQLTAALIDLAKASGTDQCPPKICTLIIDGLFTAMTNVNFNEETLQHKISSIRKKVQELNPAAASIGDLDRIWQADEDIRSLKSLILFGIRGTAAYAHHAAVLGYTNDEVNRFFTRALTALGTDLGMDELLPIVLETGRINLLCMELLDQANNEQFGTPEPTTVALKIKKGPFIVISGHDLYDLKCLLEQTKDTGIAVYTHGEMLPAHAYPELKRYTHLRGHFGTGWQNQQKEFDHLPAPVLFTTNCLMPVKDSYCDRVFTTSVVSYPEMVHIGPDKDFTPVIEKALALGGYDSDQNRTGLNGGTSVTTGFGHNAVLSQAETIVNAVKQGNIRHFFLVGGCDGAKGSRSYYTDFVKQTPDDTIILTLACGKFRFHDLDAGDIGGIPRILDMGQCNDAFSAIKVAQALAEAFSCGINDLPLTLVLSWYEQKAVSILLTLLHLGMKNILLGPSLPAFVSPNVLQFLIDNFQIGPISSPEEDLKKILG